MAAQCLPIALEWRMSIEQREEQDRAKRKIHVERQICQQYFDHQQVLLATAREERAVIDMPLIFLHY